MTPNEVTAARQSFGMSRLEFGIAMGLGGKHENIRTQVQKWERDPSKSTHVPIPPKYVLKIMELREEIE